MLFLLSYIGQEEELSLSTKNRIITNIEYCMPVIIFKHLNRIISLNSVILKWGRVGPDGHLATYGNILGSPNQRVATGI